MGGVSGRPDIARLDLPVDAWTEPFWSAAREHRLVLPRCAACGLFRWPPGPFCPHCNTQRIDWVDPGEGRIYSFTILAPQPAVAGVPLAPALIEFPMAQSMRLIAALVDCSMDAIAIGRRVAPVWVEAVNVTVPMFRLV